MLLIFVQDSSSGSVAEASSSKFSRWFKPEDDPHHHPHQSSAPRGGRYPGDGVFGVESTSSGLIPQSLQHFGTGMYYIPMYMYEYYMY